MTEYVPTERLASVMREEMTRRGINKSQLDRFAGYKLANGKSESGRVRHILSIRSPYTRVQTADRILNALGLDIYDVVDRDEWETVQQQAREHYSHAASRNVRRMREVRDGVRYLECLGQCSQMYPETEFLVSERGHRRSLCSQCRRRPHLRGKPRRLYVRWYEHRDGVLFLRCSRCMKEKPCEGFTPRPSKSDIPRYHSHCRQCHREARLAST